MPRQWPLQHNGMQPLRSIHLRRPPRRSLRPKLGRCSQRLPCHPSHRRTGRHERPLLQRQTVRRLLRPHSLLQLNQHLGLQPARFPQRHDPSRQRLRKPIHRSKVLPRKLLWLSPPQARRQHRSKYPARRKLALCPRTRRNQRDLHLLRAPRTRPRQRHQRPPRCPVPLEIQLHHRLLESQFRLPKRRNLHPIRCAVPPCARAGRGRCPAFITASW